jgi:hypothetical protein
MQYASFNIKSKSIITVYLGHNSDNTHECVG